MLIDASVLAVALAGNVSNVSYISTVTCYTVTILADTVIAAKECRCALRHV
jgi:hypothetical protein